MTGNPIASVLEKYPGKREDLIPILQDVQDVEGYLSPESINRVSRRLRVSENYIYGVATFYAQFRFEPPGEHIIHVCLGTACHVRGGEQITASLEHRLGITRGEITPDGKYELNYVACLGCCALAPVVKINEMIHRQMSVLKIRQVLDEYDSEADSNKAGKGGER